jgi:hypothetical protein
MVVEKVKHKEMKKVKRWEVDCFTVIYQRIGVEWDFSSVK